MSVYVCTCSCLISLSTVCVHEPRAVKGATSAKTVTSPARAHRANPAKHRVCPVILCASGVMRGNSQVESHPHCAFVLELPAALFRAPS